MTTFVKTLGSDPAGVQTLLPTSHFSHSSSSSICFIVCLLFLFKSFLGFTFRVVIIKELLSCCCGQPWFIMTTLYKGLPLPYVTFWFVRYIVLEIWYYGIFNLGAVGAHWWKCSPHTKVAWAQVLVSTRVGWVFLLALFSILSRNCL